MIETPSLSSSELEDSELLDRIARGDSHAFDTLFRKHHAALLLIANKSLRDRDAAEDMVCACFEQILISARWFDGRRRFLPWVVGILRNLVIDQKRMSARRGSTVRLDSLQELVYEEPGFADLSDLGLSLYTALRELPAEAFEILRLVVDDGADYPEIATELHLPVGQVKLRVFRAKQLLRELASNVEL